ncbi:hypothetical protein ACFXJO_42590, partial [Streptomyces lavendulae]
MTEYPTSQEGPQPAVASGGGTDEPGHGKAPIAAAEAVRTHAQTPAADLPRPRGAAGSGGPQGTRTSGHDAADTGSHLYTLLAVEEAGDGVALTLAVEGGAETGGGLWYQQSTAVTCVDFVFPEAAAEIRTEGAACGDAVDAASYDEVVPFSDLQV